MIALEAPVPVNRWKPAAWISAGLGGYALIGGLLTLLGWTLDIQRLTDWGNTGISQMPNNALCISVAGAALILLALGQRRVAIVLGAFVGLLAAATLSQYFTGLDLGIDRLLVYREWGQRGTFAPGRMGPPGSTSLTIIGLSLILISFNRTRRFAVVGGMLTVCIAMLTIIGYLYHADRLYTLPRLTTIAWQTSTMLLALGIGLVITVRECRPIRTVLEDSGAGQLVRRALVGVILLPIVFGWLLVHGVQAELFDTAFGTALLVLALMTMLTALLGWSAAAVRVHETSARAGQERLAGILGSITDSFFTLDKDWCFAFVNDETVHRFGKPRDQIVGGHIWEMFPDAVGNEAHEQLQRAMSERMTVEYELFYTPWQRWFAGRAYPTADGGLAVFSRDITDRKSIEDALKNSESELSDFFDNAVLGLHWVGPDGIILRANQADMDLLGVTQDEYIGRHIADFHADAHVIADILRRLQAGEYLRDYPARLRCKDGSIKDVLIDSSVRWEEDRFIHTRCFTRDVTKLRKAEEALKDADRRKDEFLATLAHELRNPLAAIGNSLELVKLAPGDTDLITQARSTMERQFGHMVRLIDDLLDVSRITSNKLALRTERVELSSIIHHALEGCDPLVSAANHELTVTLPTEPIYLIGDPIRLAQVFGNLLTNACKYTRSGGRIGLTVERQGSDVVVSIKDNGMGIPPDMLPKVFEIFTQIDRSLEKSQGGLGVGLTLVKRFVELHEGTITAHSDGLGQGSEFIVRLPISIEKLKTEQRFEPTAEPIPNVARRILVVDDNRDAAHSLAMLLELSGNEVQSAHDGVEAVDKAAAFKPDAILLDIGLPKMNGYDACRRIREQPSGKDILMVALTGWGQDDDRRKSQEAGFDGHLVKPVDLSALTKLLNATAGDEEIQQNICGM